MQSIQAQDSVERVVSEWQRLASRDDEFSLVSEHQSSIGAQLLRRHRRDGFLAGHALVDRRVCAVLVDFLPRRWVDDRRERIGVRARRGTRMRAKKTMSYSSEIINKGHAQQLLRRRSQTL